MSQAQADDMALMNGPAVCLLFMFPIAYRSARLYNGRLNLQETHNDNQI